MSAPQKFRSAFNGFNREDVVHYLEYLNSRHAAHINQLVTEADQLRSQLNAAQPAPCQDESVAALQQERDELRAQVAALQERCAALEAAQPAAPAISAADELEIYRRAERTERAARDRADLIHRQTNTILMEASVRVNEAASQITPAADQLLAQLNQLQAAITAGRQSLQDANMLLVSLRSDNI